MRVAKTMAILWIPLDPVMPIMRTGVNTAIRDPRGGGALFGALNGSDGGRGGRLAKKMVG